MRALSLIVKGEIESSSCIGCSSKELRQGCSLFRRKQENCEKLVHKPQQHAVGSCNVR